MLPKQGDIVRVTEDTEGECYSYDIDNSWLESSGRGVKLPKGTFLKYSKTSREGTGVFVIPPPIKARRFIKKIKGPKVHFYQLRVMIDPYKLVFYSPKLEFKMKDIEDFYCGTED